MTSRDFCYWLQGYIEIGGGSPLTEFQMNVVKRHLDMVFEHEIDPSHGPAEHQAKLSAMHAGPNADGSRPRC